VSDNPADFAKTSQAAMSIVAMAIPVNPWGPSKRKRPWSFCARTSGAAVSPWINGCKASMSSAIGLRAIGV
jgi:hypothetical protein